MIIFEDFIDVQTKNCFVNMPENSDFDLKNRFNIEVRAQIIKQSEFTNSFLI